jgi:signal transduction histidine kinase
MQQLEVPAGMSSRGMDISERKRVEAVVETLATIGSRGESVAEVAHDARNMVTALGLYCDLLEEPGVLATPFAHYGNELRLVAAASRKLVEKLAVLNWGRETGSNAGLKEDMLARPMRPERISGQLRATGSDTDGKAAGGRGLASRLLDRAGTGRSNGPAGLRSQMEEGRRGSRAHETSIGWNQLPSVPIHNLAAELLANHNLLAALAGPTIVLTVDVEGGARGVRLTGEDLTRMLVNLVKNSSEAMPAGGRIQIELSELPASAGAVETLLLTIEDNGPGIPADAHDEIFNSGYTTRGKAAEARGSWPVIHRGLGLAITRSMVESAGGRVTASNRSQGGARFQIELPVR